MYHKHTHLPRVYELYYLYKGADNSFQGKTTRKSITHPFEVIVKINVIIKMFGRNYGSLTKIKIIILRKNGLNSSMEKTLAPKSCLGSRHVPVTETFGSAVVEGVRVSPSGNQVEAKPYSDLVQPQRGQQEKHSTTVSFEQSRMMTGVRVPVMKRGSRR